MYCPKPGTKQDPVRRWNLSDRAFFGHGACHILAFAFLERFPNRDFYPVWIKPGDGHRGNHVFVTDGSVAFDYRGYLNNERLVSYHWQQYCREYPGWNAELVRVEANLCDPAALASLGMIVRAPEDFLHNALPRARQYLSKYNKQHTEYVRP
ncbi:MAG: hypothetical protein AB8C46_16045 [Burkholderiaceae bacterium]